MAVRSSRLGMAQVQPPGNVVLHQVPDGFTTIVKSVWLNNGVAATNNLQLIARPLAGLPDIHLLDVQLDSAATLEKNLWFVMEEGDVLFTVPLGGMYRIWVSGAILPNRP